MELEGKFLEFAAPCGDILEGGGERDILEGKGREEREKFRVFDLFLR